jgi:hypothetical protein
MGSLSDILINAVSQLWHLFPIIIIIILFKKFMDNKDKKTRKNKNEENEKNGLTLKVRAVKKYEDIAYKVVEEEGNLICTKEDKTLIIQCNNSIEVKSIHDEDIKAFYTSAMSYVKENQIEIKNTEFRYVIAYKDALDKSAIRILMDDFYNCKYVVL